MRNCSNTFPRLVLLTFGSPSVTYARNLYKIISTELESLTVENGSKLLLSVGERQQFVLANFFGNNPSLLVLGKSADNPDTQSEAKIWETFENVKEIITIDLVSNRPVPTNVLHHQRVLKANVCQLEEIN